MTHKKAILFSGLIWMGIGCFLSYRGLYYLIQGEGVLFDTLQPLMRSSGATLLFLLGVAIILGNLKSRYVLSKTVKKVVKRVVLKPSPVKFHKLYGVSYYVIIALMICVGMTLRFLPISVDVRGFFDLTIGAALMSGASLYFKSLSLLHHL